MTVGEYDDGTLGEVFIKMSKQDSTLAGVMDAFSVSISIGLQYGVPLEAFVSKYINMRFDPAGMTDDDDIRIAQSVMNYLFRRLALDYLPLEKRAELGIFSADATATVVFHASKPAIWKRSSSMRPLSPVGLEQGLLLLLPHGDGLARQAGLGVENGRGGSQLGVQLVAHSDLLRLGRRFGLLHRVEAGAQVLHLRVVEPGLADGVTADCSSAWSSVT